MKNEDLQKNLDLARGLISEQNFAASVVAGAVAALLASAAYGITVATWPFAYGFAAAAIGIVVGLSMQFVGRGIAAKFALIAAFYTLAACALGHVFALAIDLAQASGSGLVDILRDNPATVLARQSVSGLSVVHFVSWLVAVVFAMFLAKRPLSRAQRLAIGVYELRG